MGIANHTAEYNHKLLNEFSTRNINIIICVQCSLENAKTDSYLPGDCGSYTQWKWTSSIIFITRINNHVDKLGSNYYLKYRSE